MWKRKYCNSRSWDDPPRKILRRRRIWWRQARQSEAGESRQLVPLKSLRGKLSFSWSLIRVRPHFFWRSAPLPTEATLPWLPRHSFSNGNSSFSFLLLTQPILQSFIFLPCCISVKNEDLTLCFFSMFFLKSIWRNRCTWTIALQLERILVTQYQ